MNPEEVFKGWNTTEWAMFLCRLLLKHKRQLERQFGEQGRYPEFCKAITCWKDEHLNDQQQPWSKEAGERTAMALYGICQEFGVIQFMVCEGLIATEVAQGTRSPCRGGAVRVRGLPPSKATIRELKEHMQEVARLYEIARHE